MRSRKGFPVKFSGHLQVCRPRRARRACSPPTPKAQVSGMEVGPTSTRHAEQYENSSVSWGTLQSSRRPSGSEVRRQLLPATPLLSLQRNLCSPQRVAPQGGCVPPSRSLTVRASHCCRPQGTLCFHPDGWHRRCLHQQLQFFFCLDFNNTNTTTQQTFPPTAYTLIPPLPSFCVIENKPYLFCCGTGWRGLFPVLRAQHIHRTQTPLSSVFYLFPFFPFLRGDFSV